MGVDATPRQLNPRDRPNTDCVGGWEAGLDGAENLDPTGVQSPDHPACSRLVY